jgi:hypothetical protein
MYKVKKKFLSFLTKEIVGNFALNDYLNYLNLLNAIREYVLNPLTVLVRTFAYLSHTGDFLIYLDTVQDSGGREIGQPQRPLEKVSSYVKCVFKTTHASRELEP